MSPTNPHLPCTCCRHQQCIASQLQCRFCWLCPSTEYSAQVQVQQRMTQVWWLLLSYHLTAQILWFPSSIASSPLFLQALLIFKVTVGQAHLTGWSHVMNSPMFSRQTIQSAFCMLLWTKASAKCPKCKCEWFSLHSLLIMLIEMCIPITSHLVTQYCLDMTILLVRLSYLSY